MIHPFDHLVVAVIAALFPMYAWFETRRTERRLAAQDAEPIDAVRESQRTIAWLFILGALGAVNWFYQGRDADVLGLGTGASPLRWAAGAALALVGLGLTGLQAAKVGRDPDMRADIRSQIDRFAFWLPRTSRQLRWFNGVALSAGLNEEILYRGFLIWYLQHWMGAIPALLVSSAVFGLAHSYQGLSNAPRAAFIGLWMGIIYLVTGALWLAMATHFFFDVIAGRMIFAALSERTAEEERPEPASQRADQA